jgi:hypothetical protein
MTSDKIWCFWEPRDNIHGYLELCLDTWQRLGREIVMLDNSSLDQYLSKRELKILRETRHFYSLPQYADAVRVMILHHYGGIWMDLDTVILSQKEFRAIEELKSKTELLMIDRHIGWIWASKNSQIMNKWYRQLMSKLDFNKYKLNRDGFMRKIWRIIKTMKYMLFNEPDKMRILIDYINEPKIGWDYLGNSIVNDLLDTASEEEYISLTTVWPYVSFVPESATWDKNVGDTDKPSKYQMFWFGKTTKSGRKIASSSPLVYLHNSWTPEKYKKMNSTVFLKSKIRLAEILRQVL